VEGMLKRQHLPARAIAGQDAGLANFDSRPGKPGAEGDVPKDGDGSTTPERQAGPEQSQPVGRGAPTATRTPEGRGRSPSRPRPCEDGEADHEPGERHPAEGRSTKPRFDDLDCPDTGGTARALEGRPDYVPLNRGRDGGSRAQLPADPGRQGHADLVAAGPSCQGGDGQSRQRMYPAVTELQQRPGYPQSIRYREY